MPHATLIPHVYPVQQPGLPLYSLGLRPPRTALGRLGWKATGPVLEMGLRRGRDELNETRARLGLAPIERFHGGISELAGDRGDVSAAGVSARVAGARAGDGAAVLRVAGRRTWRCRRAMGRWCWWRRARRRTRSASLLRVALDGLGGGAGAGAGDDQPSTGRSGRSRYRRTPSSSTGCSYSQAMPAADVVICHGGHGTVARALAAGKPLLVCPSVGDMGENAARVAWSGTGLSVPRRLLSPRAIRLATRRLLGRAELPGQRRCTWPSGREAHDGAVGPRSSSSSRPERDEPALAGSCLVPSRAPGVGLEPTTSRLTAARSTS